MRKTKICIWMGTRRRSTSRLSMVVGLAGVSGYKYWTGLPAAPLIGLRRVALKYKEIYAENRITKLLPSVSVCAAMQMLSLTTNFNSCTFLVLGRNRILPQQPVKKL